MRTSVMMRGDENRLRDRTLLPRRRCMSTVTDLPFRNWCRHCVFGKGVSSPHQKLDKKEKIGITISMDYCFMNDDEKEEDTSGPLVIWDDSYECLWALPVDHKGPVVCVVK